MLKSSGAMGGATLLSRILGMVREMVCARFMGDSAVASAFIFAFQVPNLFRRLLGEGALSASLVPILKETEVRFGEKSMWETANVALSLLFCLCSAAIVLVVGVGSFLLWFGGWDMKTELLLKLMRVMSPYILLVCAAAVLMGICNARGIFFLPALNASVLNIIMILSVFFLAPQMGDDLQEQVFGLVMGVLVAGGLQMLLQLPALARQGFRLRFVLPWKHPAAAEVVGRMSAGIVGIAAYQINVLLSSSIAFGEADYIVSSFNYAVRLMELPQGVIGVSLATFLLPTLSGLAAEKKYPEFHSVLKKGVGYVIYANFLASVLLFVLAEPIVRLLFERGQFGPESTMRCQLALKCLVPGLVAFSLVNVCTRAFFALGDIKTPMRISVVCLGVNLLLTVLLIRWFQQGGMGMANSASAFLNLGLLIYALKRKFRSLILGDVCKELRAVVASGVLTGLLVWGARLGMEGMIGSRTLGAQMLTVFIPLLLGGSVYVVVTYRLNVRMARDIWDLAKPKLDKWHGIG